MSIDKAKLMKLVARWHRRMAVAISIWLVLLAASGVLINHAHDWRLDRTALPGPMQRVLYGITGAMAENCSATSIGTDCNDVFGQLSLPTGILLLSGHSLFLIDGRGQLIEKLPIVQLGLASLEAGLLQGSDIYLRGTQKTIQTNSELLTWHAIDLDTGRRLENEPWQTRGAATSSITWERLLLDLHAARFLGPLAKGFNDLMALLILVLAVSGIWLYAMKRTR